VSRTGPDPIDRRERAPVELVAPAKLTLSLRVTGVRPDGFHLIEAEMVSLDLADTLVVAPGNGLEVVGDAGPLGGSVVSDGPDNLVVRALAAVDRKAWVRLIKRVPAGAGLGGGSSDAGAILRWAGCADLDLAAALGADVPFCIHGGRAEVAGIGEVVRPLPFEERRFTLLLLPFGVDTGAVYRAWDDGGGVSRRPSGLASGNDLEASALRVEPRLAPFKDAFAAHTGREPRLAGSGSTWFVDGWSDAEATSVGTLGVEGMTARMVPVRTVPAQA
jgi:4-diphosphocytidyl-2-C-methyl-D-erythritol kinase